MTNPLINPSSPEKKHTPDSPTTVKSKEITAVPLPPVKKVAEEALLPLPVPPVAPAPLLSVVPVSVPPEAPQEAGGWWGTLANVGGYIASTRVGGYLGVGVKTVAHNLGRGAMWTAFYNFNREELDKKNQASLLPLINQEGVADIMRVTHAISSKLKVVELLDSVVDDKVKQESSWFSPLRDFAVAEKDRIDNTIPCAILGILTHIIEFANNNFPNITIEAAKEPKDALTKMFVRLIDRFGANLEDLKVIEQIENNEERKKRLFEVFQKLTRNIAKEVFPKKGDDLEIPYVAQKFLNWYWDSLIDTTIPNLLLSYYEEIRNPVQTAQQKSALIGLPNGPQILDFADTLADKVTNSTWSYLGAYPVLGRGWNFLDEAVRQFFQPQFGFTLKNQKDTTQYITSFKEIVTALDDSNKVLTTGYQRLNQARADILASKKNPQDPAVQKELQDHVDTCVKTVSDEITKMEGIVACHRKLVLDDDLTPVLTPYQEVKTQIESIKSMADSFAKTHALLDGLGKTIDKTAGTRNNFQSHLEDLNQAPEEMKTYFKRMDQTKGAVRIWIHSLMVQIFSHLKDVLAVTEIKDFIPLLANRLILITKTKLSDAQLDSIRTLKQEITAIDLQLEEDKKDIVTHYESIKTLEHQLKEIRVKFSTANGNTKVLFDLSKEESALKDNLQKEIREKEDLEQKEKELQEKRIAKISGTLEPFTTELLTMVGYNNGDLLPMPSSLRPIVFDVMKEQTQLFLYDNVMDTLLFMLNKPEEEKKLEAWPEEKEAVSTIVKGLSHELQEQITGQLQNTASMLPIVEESFVNNEMPLQKETTSWIVDGMQKALKTEGAKPLLSMVEEYTQSLIFYILGTILKGKEAQSIEKSISDWVLTHALNPLLKVPAAQLLAIKSTVDPKEKQKLIADTFGPLSLNLLKSLGFESAASFPAPAVLRETIWSTLNAQINSLLSYYTIDTLILLSQKAQNEITVMKNPEGKQLLHLAKALAQKTKTATRDYVGNPENMQTIIEGNIQDYTGVLLNKDDSASITNHVCDLTDTLEGELLENYTYSLLVSIFAQQKPNMKELMTKLVGVFKNQLTKIPANAMEEIRTIDQTTPSLDMIAATTDPVQKQQKLKERKEKYELRRKKIDEAFAPVSSSLLSVLGIDSVASLPIPPSVQETIAHQINNALYNQYEPYYGVYQKLGNQPSKPKTAIHPIVDTIISKTLASTKAYMLDPATIKEGLPSFFEGDDLRQWLGNTIGAALQEEVLANPETLEVSKMWDNVSAKLQPAVQQLFTNILNAEGGIDPNIKSDPQMVKRAAGKLLKMTNEHLKLIHSGTKITPMAEKDFAKNLTKEIWDLVLPNGLSEVSLDNEAQQLTITDAKAKELLQGQIEKYFKMVSDPKQRSAYILEQVQNINKTLGGSKVKTPEDLKQALVKTFDLAAKFAFVIAWETIQSLPNSMIGKIFGEKVLHGKQKLDQLFNLIFGTFLNILLMTILRPLVIIVTYLYHRKTTKISEELIRIINMPEHTKLFQDLALATVGMLKDKGKSTDDIDKAYQEACLELTKQLGGFKDLGFISTVLKRFPNQVANSIVANTVPFMPKGDFNQLLVEANKMMTTIAPT